MRHAPTEGAYSAAWERLKGLATDPQIVSYVTRSVEAKCMSVPLMEPVVCTCLEQVARHSRSLGVFIHIASIHEWLRSIVNW